jgi:hypothetical protein
MPKTKQHKVEKKEEGGKTLFELSAEGYSSLGKGLKWSMSKLKKNLK